MTDPRKDSSKKRQERSDDLLIDVVERPLQDDLDGPSFDGELRPLLESYAEGRRALHVHFRVSVAGGVVPRDYCILFYRAPDDFDARQSDRVRSVEGYVAWHGLSQMGKPMLVDVVQLVENPQEVVRRGGFIPSIVRLQSLKSVFAPALMYVILLAPALRLFQSARVRNMGNSTVLARLSGIGPPYPVSASW
jgi:hypothetical protein